MLYSLYHMPFPFCSWLLTDQGCKVLHLVAMPVHKSSIELFLRSLDDALVGCISIFIDLTELAQLRNVEGEI